MINTIRDLGPANVEALQNLLESVPDYAERIAGYPPGPADAPSALISVPLNFPRASVEPACGMVPTSSPLPTSFSVTLIPPRPISDFSSCTATTLGRAWDESSTTRFLRAFTGNRPPNACGSGSSRRTRLQRNHSGEHSDTCRPANGKPYHYDKLSSTVTLWERPIARAH